jgi:uncharacterized membrane protein YbhN (UPF0104 family)
VVTLATPILQRETEPLRPLPNASGGLALSPPVSNRRGLLHGRKWWLAALLVATGLVLLGTPLADGDVARDLLATAATTVRNLGRLPWQVAPVLLVVVCAHYVAAAIALRAAAGARLPLREVIWVQLAAATANRLTPAGLGGAAVNTRYLRRRDFRTTQALATVAVLGGLGALADIIVFACLALAGRWVGISGGSHELSALGAKLSGPWHTFASLPWPATAGTSVAIAIGVGAATRRARRARHRRQTAAANIDRSSSSAVRPILFALLRQPRRVATIFSASAATTLLLAAGFAFTALVASPPSSANFGGLVIGYLIGGAVGTAVPTPAGIGSTEAALVAILLIAHIPLAVAIGAMLTFRLITFWVPAVVGLLAMRLLRRRRLL